MAVNKKCHSREPFSHTHRSVATWMEKMKLFSQYDQQAWRKINRKSLFFCASWKLISSSSCSSFRRDIIIQMRVRRHPSAPLLIDRHHPIKWETYVTKCTSYRPRNSNRPANWDEFCQVSLSFFCISGETNFLNVSWDRQHSTASENWVKYLITWYELATDLLHSFNTM